MGKDWKQVFLSSGLPLEYLVRKIFRDLDYLVFVEHSYIRFNENNLATNFSIDLRAIRRNDLNKFSELLLVECKYRSPGTYWAFIQNQHQEPFDTVASPFETHDFMASRKLLPSHSSKNFSQRDYVWKGIELNEKDNNPSSITRAISQVQYAFLESFIDHAQNSIRHIYNKIISDNIPYLVANIIVTTAEIKVIKDEVSLEDFRNAKNPEEIMNTRDYVILDSPPDPYFSQYARSRLLNALSPEILSKDGINVNLIGTIGAKVSKERDEYIDRLALLFPRYYIIVNYEKINSLICLLDRERKDVKGLYI